MKRRSKKEKVKEKKVLRYLYLELYFREFLEHSKNY
jgi:hypothetical protein